MAMQTFRKSPGPNVTLACLSMLTPRLGKRIITFVGILLAASIPAVGQVLTSSVDGTVRDQTGAFVPGVAVELTNVETNAARETVTNDSGLFVFPQVPRGPYRLTTQLPGFKTAVIEGVRVALDTPASVDIILEVGEVHETITVTATETQSVVNDISAEINTNLNREQVKELPLNGRGVAQLALTQAGVTSRGGARTAAINGTRGTFNNLTLDGINNQDTFIRTDALFGVIPLQESFIEEVNITTANSEVDAGLGASQTQFVTRSGSNEFHGELFYYNRNDALNATNFFNNAAGIDKEKVLIHQFGFNVGGPIVKDNLFFFVNYEEERSPSSASVVRRVLTDSARAGDFGYVRQDSGQVATLNLFDLTGLTADPTVKALIDLTPLPNDASVGDGRNISGFRFNSPDRSESDWLVFRGDYKINERHSFTGSFHQFRTDTPNSVFNGIDAVFPGLPGGGQGSVRRLASFSLNSEFTPTIINEGRFGFQTGSGRFFNNETFSQGYRLSFSSEGDLFSNPIRNFLAQGRDTRNLDLMDNVTWVNGLHTIKVGGSVRWTRVDLFNDAGIVPTYILEFGAGNQDPLVPGLFPGGISSGELSTASGMLGVLGGFVDTAEQRFNVTSPASGYVDGASQTNVLNQNFLTFYLGDTWRLTPNLTLSSGFRWEFHSVPDETQGLALLPLGGVESVLDPGAIIDFAGATNGRPFFNADRNNFAPSIGVAWRVSDNTVLRGSYGLNYVIDNNFTTVLNALRGNDGLSQLSSVPGIRGTVSGNGLLPIPTPEFKIPRTARDGILADPLAAIFTIDPNLRTPYVQQWNVGIQHEIMQNTAVELRYVGNHGVKLSRAVDLNQLLLPPEFVEEFRSAQRNLAANASPYAGEPLTIFHQLGFGGFLQSGGVQNWIRNGEIGQYIGGFLAANREFFFAGEGGERFGATLPISYFYRNPNAFVGDLVGNNAFSKYNALQFEIRRSFRSGFTGQFNYTWGKVLTNFSGSQSNFRGLFDNAQPQLEIMRPDYDITHTYNANWVWEIPIGQGRRWMDTGGILDAIVGGWDLSGFLRIRSGETVNIVSGRGTINRGGSRGLTNTVHLQGIDIKELQRRTGSFRDSQGRVTLFDSTLIAPEGGGNPEFFQNPGLLEAGTLAMSPVSGPWYASLDLGIRKSFPIPITEGARLQLRFDFFNSLNRTNFNVSSQPPSGTLDDLGVFNRQNPNSAQFGLISSAFAPRQIQVGAKIIF